MLRLCLSVLVNMCAAPFLSLYCKYMIHTFYGMWSFDGHSETVYHQILYWMFTGEFKCYPLTETVELSI